jgi:hypothetical protein
VVDGEDDASEDVVLEGTLGRTSRLQPVGAHSTGRAEQAQRGASPILAGYAGGQRWRGSRPTTTVCVEQVQDGANG